MYKSLNLTYLGTSIPPTINNCAAPIFIFTSHTEPWYICSKLSPFISGKHYKLHSIISVISNNSIDQMEGEILLIQKFHRGS